MIKKILPIVIITGLSISSKAQETACPKHITTAINPTTSSIVDFPTACDVPAGWILVNDSFSLRKYQSNAIKFWSQIKDKRDLFENKWNNSKDEREELKDAVSDFYEKLTK